MFWCHKNIQTCLSFVVPLTGWRPPGDASVCHPDRSAAWTPGGPGPDQRRLCQCLCRTAGYPGKVGARDVLGTSQLGPDLNPTTSNLFTGPLPRRDDPPPAYKPNQTLKWRQSQRIPQFSSRFAAESLSSWYHRWIKVYLSESLEEQLEIKLSIWNCRFCSLLQLYQPNDFNIFCRKLVNQTTYLPSFSHCS